MTGGRLVALVAGSLTVGAALAAALATVPRPSSFRDLTYVLIPVLGAVVLVAAVWLSTP